ncbi:MAG TPA: non-homologous end-joining DNA ligase [Acidimicrobiales bacterium]|nr:non-homologous end-joining DNA ligase [Acidimicrobiales bacterium]
MTTVEIDGRTLNLSNLDKVLYPQTGTTKAEIIDYYARIAPVMARHMEARPITLVRYPNGVDDKHFFEKNCPKHKPEWLPTIAMDVSAKTKVEFCELDEPAAFVWTANLAALELHPGLARKEDLDSPTVMVFDLDPGPPATAVECAQVALWLREALERLSLEGFVKTSGKKGLQLYVPLNTPTSFEKTREMSLALAQVLERVHPDHVLTEMTKALRAGKVFIDWSQNARHKTTIGVYSLRAFERPTCSTPITWDELEDGHAGGDPEAFRFEMSAVLDRVDRHGDLFAPVLEMQQELPAVS